MGAAGGGQTTGTEDEEVLAMELDDVGGGGLEVGCGGSGGWEVC